MNTAMHKNVIICTLIFQSISFESALNTLLFPAVLKLRQTWPLFFGFLIKCHLFQTHNTSKSKQHKIHTLALLVCKTAPLILPKIREKAPYPLIMQPSVADWGEGRGEHLAPPPPQESSMRIKKMTALQKLHLLNKKRTSAGCRGGGGVCSPPLPPWAPWKTKTTLSLKKATTPPFTVYRNYQTDAPAAPNYAQPPTPQPPTPSSPPTPHTPPHHQRHPKCGWHERRVPTEERAQTCHD